MNWFRFFWSAHKWTGVTLAAVLAISAVTGFLLLLKKDYAWIQPATQVGSPGPLTSFLSVDDVWQAIATEAHPDFATQDDIDRIDVRPSQFVFKVRAKRGGTEAQVCATTGRVLSLQERRSDWIEDLHDGSFFGRGMHTYVMPVVACGLLFLVLSGLWLWIGPILKRRQKRRRHAATRKQGAS